MLEDARDTRTETQKTADQKRGNRSAEELLADQQTDAFLKQCERDGKLTTEELTDLSVNKGASGDTRPRTLARFADFVQTVCQDTGWPEEDVERCLRLHLEEARLTPRHIELYLNYPDWTQGELAEIFGMKARTVGHYLSRVRKVWPALRLDGTKRYGVPNFKDMKRLHTSLVFDKKGCIIDTISVDDPSSDKDKAPKNIKF